MKKQLFILMMMMLTALTAQAAEYGIKIDGQSVNDDNKADLAASIFSISGGTASYDSESKKLSLTDVMIDCTGGAPGLEITQDELTIEVNGSCSINNMGGNGFVISGLNSHVTLKGKGTLNISGSNGIFLGDEYNSSEQHPKLTIYGPTLIVDGNSSNDDEGYGIRGIAQISAYYGELELVHGTIKASSTHGSICLLGAITVYENATLVQPANAKITEHDVRYEPWTGYVLTEMVIIEAPKPDIETPLTIEAKEDATVTISNPNELTIGYSINDGNIVWTADINVDLSAGSKMELYGDNKTYCKSIDESLVTTISMSGDCYVYGNVMSLIQSSGFETLKKLDTDRTFRSLFKDNTHLLSHPKKQIVLPALELSTECYDGMFRGCSNMTKAPKLPATTLKNYCYSGMFLSCSSLVEAPELPATTLKKFCYSSMFMYCTSLTSAPVLLAEKLEESSYVRMFWGCTNLKSVTCLAINISAYQCTWCWLYDVSATGTLFKAKDFDGWITDDPSGVPSGWTLKEDDTKDVCGLAFTPTELTVNYGEEYTLPILTNPHSLPVTYSSSDPTVATVDAETGALTILKVGTTIITATFAGSSSYYSGSASYTLTAVGKGDAPVFAFDREMVLTTFGKSCTAPVLTMSDGLTAKYASNNTSVAIVDASTGKVTIFGKGIATITATTDGNMEYAAATAKYHIAVLENAEKVRCDANADGNVTITDAVTVVNFILGGSASAPAMEEP